MKTFDKFCEERQRHYLEHPELPTEASITELEYQQIQLDAAKAGMRLAAKEIDCPTYLIFGSKSISQIMVERVIDKSNTLTLEELEKV